ncbi:DHHA1 domain-containing protein, partial [Acholeplasma sp. OttesenSCG-928-E16]|nr:DHHA1 domain-containing protein [Acholeplasma sp. OttesenSCG-928-E16]
ILRFDFNNYNQVTEEQIIKIEALVNEDIKNHFPVLIKNMNINEAKELGATALFSEKYGEEVRVVFMGDSVELCGGTHVKNTADIKGFSIISIESIGSGIYRIEAITGDGLSERIIEYMPKQLIEVKSIFMKSNPLNIKIEKEPYIGSYMDIVETRIYIEKLKKANKDNEKYLSTKKAHDALSNLEKYINSPISKRMVISTDNLEIPVLKQLVDALYDKIKAEVLFVINKDFDKATFICKSSLNNASDLIKLAASISNGSGGGKPNLAQGGTKDLSKVDLVKKTIEENL